MAIADVAPARSLDPRLRAILLAAVATALFLPFDGAIGALARTIRLPSDIEGELEMLQQYGQFTATVLGTILVLLLEPSVRRRLLDWWLALGFSSLACHPLKMVLGRPRPKLGDPYHLTFPWQTYLHAGPGGDQPLRAFDFGGADLWSMPSSHTAAATVMSLFLARLFPRLRGFALGMVIAVGLCRVVLAKHWPSDVAVGALVGYLAGDAVWRGAWGQRLWSTLRGRG
jgi:membrane-associated phospholipid phosphatase